MKKFRVSHSHGAVRPMKVEPVTLTAELDLDWMPTQLSTNVELTTLMLLLL